MYYFVGVDPGDSNFGYSILEASVKKSKLIINIVEVGMLESQINNLTSFEVQSSATKRKLKQYRKKKKTAKRKLKPVEIISNAPFNDQLHDFYMTFDGIFNEYNSIKSFTGERFQARGLRGTSIEHVSLMNGICALLCLQKSSVINLITAATWKNQVNKFITLEDSYKSYDITPHSVDSVYIGIYGVLEFFELWWNNVDFKDIDKQLKQFELQ